MRAALKGKTQRHVEETSDTDSIIEALWIIEPTLSLLQTKMHAALNSRRLIHNLYHKKMGVRPFKILLFFMKVKSEQNPWKELTSVAVANSKSAKTIGIPSSLHRNILSSPRPFAFFCVFSFFFYSSNFSYSSRLHTHTHTHTHYSILSSSWRFR